jgi:hypothetical protein
MIHRWMISLTAALVALAAAPASSNPPRTPDGHSDLEGIWTNATLTPLERPTILADKEFLTEQEAADFAKQALQQVDADRRDGGAATDVNRAYNEFWRDRGKVVPSRRTSLIIDTPHSRPDLRGEKARRRPRRSTPVACFRRPRRSLSGRTLHRYTQCRPAYDAGQLQRQLSNRPDT